MTCSVGMALFLVLFAIATFISELFALYLLHALITRRDGRDIQAVDMAIMFLSILLIALDGFAAVCPCFDADGNYSDLTTFWLPLFYGLFTVLSKLITFDVFRDIAYDPRVLPSRTVQIYQCVLVFTLFMVLLTTACLGSLTAATLAVYIVSLCFLHFATLFVLMTTLKSIAQHNAQNSQGRARVFSLSKSKSKSQANVQTVDDHERDSASNAAMGRYCDAADDAAELLKLSRVLRSAVTSAVLFAVLALFAIWLSALSEPSTSVVALFFFAICTVGVVVDMLCAALLRTDLATPWQLYRESKSANSRSGKASSSHWWVPQNKRLLGEDEDEDLEARDRDHRRMREHRSSIGRATTPATFDEAEDGSIVIRYTPDMRSQQQQPMGADGQSGAYGSQLDKYTKPTLADPTSYTQAEKELDDLMHLELAKKSANSDDQTDAQSQKI